MKLTLLLLESAAFDHSSFAAEQRVLVAEGGKTELTPEILPTLNPLHPTPTGDSWAGGLEKGIKDRNCFSPPGTISSAWTR
ncbi:MAG: hypothetical protein WCK17_08715, partial [Verrucomicrobiota bacterium]